MEKQEWLKLVKECFKSINGFHYTDERYDKYALTVLYPLLQSAELSETGHSITIENGECVQTVVFEVTKFEPSSNM
jgi:hypothetical protein